NLNQGFMALKRYKPKFLEIEPILDKKSVQLTNNLSFKYQDSYGKEQIQTLTEFKEENKSYFDKKISLSKHELDKKSKLIKDKKKNYLFFQSPESVVWDEFQTAIRNQKNRNTCSAFAMVAAIESRYMRDYGLNLDLSEQFFWHCYKSTGLSFPKYYQYENQSSFWGGGNSQGISQAVNFAIPLESDCPYLNKTEMAIIRDQIPEAGQLNWKSAPTENTVTQEEIDAFEYSTLYISNDARQKAKYGVQSYLLFGAETVSNSTNLEWLIAWGYEVIVDANLKWKTNPISGIREFDPNSDGGWHVFLVVGYDRVDKVFYVKNSWGEGGLIRVTYEFAENCFNCGSVVTAVTDPEKPTLKTRAIGFWHMNHDGWKGKLVIRRFTNENNDITRLGHYHTSDGLIKAINGKFIHAGQGIQFSLTENKDTNPTIQQGQKFTMDIYSWDIKQAAGNTTWNNIPYGSYMNRSTFHSAYGKDFDPLKWKGNWLMNHDGWKGSLNISEVKKIPLFGWIVFGEYTTSEGSQKPILGFLNSSHSHVFRFTINFSEENNQSFIIHFHNWSSDLASGYTFWNGKRFGAVMFKK
uniref:C1 family peptidase n=1 Tax=Mangrovimonas sp. TPBH4 TaxID=1645914 RepID=UPI001E4E659C